MKPGQGTTRCHARGANKNRQGRGIKDKEGREEVGAGRGRRMEDGRTEVGEDTNIVHSPAGEEKEERIPISMEPVTCIKGSQGSFHDSCFVFGVYSRAPLVSRPWSLSSLAPYLRYLAATPWRSPDGRAGLSGLAVKLG